MTLIERIDAALAANGCRYDVSDEQFLAGERVLDWDDIIAIVGDVSDDELAAYEDHKWLTSPGAREVAQACAEPSRKYPVSIRH